MNISSRSAQFIQFKFIWFSSIVFLVVTFAGDLPAQAHHPFEGPPEALGLLQGLLSGLGHPAF